jgi:hypothetical protein
MIRVRYGEYRIRLTGLLFFGDGRWEMGDGIESWELEASNSLINYIPKQIYFY